MNDRELLELAAKAAGQERSAAGDLWSNARGQLWNPLTDDGDALRLAVKLGLQVFTSYPAGADGTKGTGVLVGAELPPEFWSAHSDDPYAATRRAIVRAAAEIGRSMP
jgi:hypothetical protein